MYQTEINKLLDSFNYQKEKFANIETEIDKEIQLFSERVEEINRLKEFIMEIKT